MAFDATDHTAAPDRGHDRRLSPRAAVLTIGGLSLLLWCGIVWLLLKIL